MACLYSYWKVWKLGCTSKASFNAFLIGVLKAQRVSRILKDSPFAEQGRTDSEVFQEVSYLNSVRITPNEHSNPIPGHRGSCSYWAPLVLVDSRSFNDPEPWTLGCHCPARLRPYTNITISAVLMRCQGSLINWAWRCGAWMLTCVYVSMCVCIYKLITPHTEMPLCICWRVGV